MSKYITTHFGTQFGETHDTIETAFRDITDGDLFSDDYGEYGSGLDLMRRILPASVLDMPAYYASDEYIRYFPAHHTDTLGNLFENGFEVLSSVGYTAIIADGALNDLASVNNALAHVYGGWTAPHGIGGIYRIEEVA